jgi:MSHA biogenesis protein MshP
MCRKNETGFSLVSAIFILVVLAVLGAALLTVSTLQHASAGIDVQGVRGYQAAASGVEWGLYRLLDPDGAPAAALPACWAGTASVTPGGSLAAFAVATTCTRTTTTELGRDIGVYTIVSTATFGAAQQPNHVSRTVSATLSRCKDPANAPSFDC